MIPASTPPPRRNPRLRILLLSALAAFVCAAFFGVRTLPEILRTRIERELTSLLRRPVTLRGLRMDPLGPAVTLEGFRVGDGKGGALFSAERVELAFEPPAPMKGPPVLSRVEVTDADLHLARDASGKWTTGDLWRTLIEAPGDPPPFTIRSLTLEDGRVEYRDGTTGRAVVLSGLRVALPFLSSLPGEAEIPIRPRISGEIDGIPFHLRALWKPFSKSTELRGEMAFEDADLPTLAPFFPSGFSLIPAAGTLGGTVRLAVVGPPEGDAEVSASGEFRAHGLEISDPASDLRIRIPELEFHGRTTRGFRRCTLSFSCTGPRAIELEKRGPQPFELSAGNASGDLDFEVPADARSPFPTLKGTVVSERIALSLPGREMSARVPLARLTLEGSPGGGHDLEAASLVLDGPEFRLPRSLLEPGGPAESGYLAKAGLPFRELEVRNGRLLWSPPFPEDAPLGPLEACDVRLKRGAHDGDIHFEGRGQAPYGASVSLSGTLDSGLSVRAGTATAEGLPLSRLRGLFPGDSPVNLAEGSARFGARFEFGDGPSGRGLRLSDGTCEIRNLRISSRPAGAELLQLPELQVRGIEVDLPGRSLAFADAEGVEGALRLQRDAEGRLNLGVPPAGTAGSEKSRWRFRAGRIAFDQCTVRMDDWSLPEPAGFAARGMNAEVLGFSAPGGGPARVRLGAEFEEGGSLTAAGALALDPPSGTLEVAVEGLSLPAFQPYYAERVAAVVVGGSLSGSGRLTIAPPQDAGPPAVTFAGDLHVAGFDSVDEARWEGLLRWQTLHLGGVDAGNAPPRLRVEDAALADFFAKVELNPDATLNLLHIVRRRGADGASAEVPAGETAPGAIRVGQLAVLGGTVDFTDRFIHPSYATTLRAVTGRLSELEAGGGTAGDVDLRGRLAPQAPFEVVGKANPFREDLFADLRASCRNVDLVPFSAYAGKYAGFAIAGGKLHLEVTYLLENRHLEAHGRIFLDQFVLGERVASEGGGNLPLKLAASLLKNRKGEILLEIPITGSLDDLNMDVKPLARKMVKNFFLRLITAPFTALGRIFGRGGVGGTMKFSPGTATPDAEGMEMLRELGDRLAARPSLRIRIAGLFEPQEDEDGLRRTMLARRLTAERAARGTPLPGGPDWGPEIDERRFLLNALAARMGIPLPKDAAGRPIPVSADALEDLVIAYTEVSLDDLRHLALERAEAVRDILLEDGRVRPGQVHIVDADALPDEAGGRRMRAIYELR